MKNCTFCFVLLCFPILLNAQNDTLPAISKIFPDAGDAYEPVFSPFCSDRLWLNEREFDIPSRRFVPKDSVSCVPTSAQRLWQGSVPVDPNPRRIQWQADPYDPNLYWTYEYRHDDSVPWLERKDTLILWRYDRKTAQQKSFVSLLQGEMTIGEPGIWVTNHKELILLDRYSGQVLSRAGNPANGEVLMFLQPWGEDVIITDRWLYQRAQNRYVSFFALPADMEGCKSPEKTEFHGELCISQVREENNRYTYHLIAPEHSPIVLPFKPKKFSYHDYLLSANPPLAWLCEADTLRSFDFITSDTVSYPGSTDQPLHGNHDGRFLGFYSELGLSFFDKYNCQFRVLQLPYGHKMPRNFKSDHRYVYLTYEKHWEIIDFSKLEKTFRRSSTLEEYAVFEQEWRATQKEPDKDFYTQYASYLKLYNRYKTSKNLKIEASWEQVRNSVSYPLYVAADSILDRVAIDFEAGRFDPSVSCQIVVGLFRYWGSKGEIQKALRLIAGGDHEICLKQGMDSGKGLLQLLKTTQYRLDSIEQLKLPPDEHLYATGKVWTEYCLKKPWFRFVIDPRKGLQQAYNYFRTLLQQYPNSLWADNAAYDTFQYIDHQQDDFSEDLIPSGNPEEAFKTFAKFLKDYPHSDRRPDVLLRMANLIFYGVHDGQYNRVGDEKAAEYFQEIEAQYPEFAKTSEPFRKAVGLLNHKRWSERWSLEVAFERDTFRFQDTVQVTVLLRNKSQSSQTLDTVFLRRWHERMSITLHTLRDKGCESTWGDFPLMRKRTPTEVQALTLLPEDSYQEVFVLGRNSMNKNYGPGKFELAKGTTYTYSMEYHHPVIQWIGMSTSGGRFTIE